MKKLFGLILLCLCLSSFADEIFPKEGWQDYYDPLASPEAVAGGDITFFLGQEPDSFNNYFDNSYSSAVVFSMMFEALLGSHPITLDYEPNLAAKWAISEDKKSYTFWIDPNARWSDGAPITAHDVKWTYDQVMSSAKVSRGIKVGLSRFDSPVVASDEKITFTANVVHWNNLAYLGGFEILPRHIFTEKKFDEMHSKFPVVSGPYQILPEKAKTKSGLNLLGILGWLALILLLIVAGVLLSSHRANRAKVVSVCGVIAVIPVLLIFLAGRRKGREQTGGGETGRKPGVYVIVAKRPDWWQKDFKRNQYKLNFKRIKFRFFSERKNALETFKKGPIDIYAVYTSKYWIEETKGAKFEKGWIAKQRIYNFQPIGFQGWAMNMRRKPFDDVRVRRAIAHLLNRERMNRVLMYSQYAMHKSYYEDLYSKADPCTNIYTKYDLDKARELLAETGWRVNPKSGKLEKDGKVFTIRFLTRSAYTNKFMAIFREDLQKVGIDLTIVQKDWAAWSKDMDEFNYDVTWAAWGASVRKDPEPMWYGKEADRKKSINITGFKNDEVDRLIEAQRTIFDIQKRHDIVRRIDAIAYRQYPYALIWYSNHVRLLYWNKFGMPDWVLSKYGDEFAALSYWWLDPNAETDLEDALKTGKALPKKPANVKFEEQFKP